MELLTKVGIDEPTVKMEHHDSVLFMGSCFANSIGRQFVEQKFPALVNPLGVVYNPLAIVNGLSFLMGEKQLSEDVIVEYDGLWHSFLHHGSFSKSGKNEFLTNIEEHRQIAADFLKNAEWLVITFGTAWVYEHQNRGLVVSNCHKVPSTEFSRYRLSKEEIFKAYEDLLVKLNVFNPALKFIFTVSPVRHWKDGAHGNQLSKAELLLAVDQLCERFGLATYFPSYEIVMDELRDYRYYSDDMLHISDFAVNYIANRFRDKYLSSDAKKITQKIEEVIKAVQHKPFNPDTDKYRVFIENTLEKIHNLEDRYTHLDFYKEKRILNERFTS